MQSRLSQLLASAALIASPALAVPATVELPNAHYTGLVLSNGITQWLGMRYAAPPTGNRRFRPPEDPEVEAAAQSATSHGNICLVTGKPADEPGHGEDCLFIDVQAPSAATNDSQLPVFVYMHGDGYNDTQRDTNINATHFLEHNYNNFIVVTFNYRVGPYGFLTHGDGMATNNGIRDQVKALDWVQKHIRRFGGNPDHVVLGGSGVGAQNVLIHLTMHDARSPYFKAIIAESPSFAQMRTLHEAEEQYHHFTVQLGCGEKNSLACLVDLPTEKIQAAGCAFDSSPTSVPPWDQWLPVVDRDLIVNTTSERIRIHHFARVPSIIGNVADVGNTFAPSDTFAPSNSSSTHPVADYIHDLYPNLDENDLKTALKIYPSNNVTCKEAVCDRVRMRRAFWDSHYTCPASAVTQAMRVNGNEPVYLYAWDVSDSKDGGRSLGALQDIEAAALWGPEHGRLPDDYKNGRINQKVPLIKQRYWANFIRSLNPNKPRVMNDLDNVKMAQGDEVQPQGWLTWYAGGHKEFYFKSGGKTMTKDSRHLKQICDFWNALAPKMNM